jgi:hypothetical protein
MSLIPTLHDPATGEHVIGPVRWMTMHALDIARRKDQYPCFQVLAPEEIYSPLAFFPLIGDAIGILYFHIDLLAFVLWVGRF